MDNGGPIVKTRLDIFKLSLNNVILENCNEHNIIKSVTIKCLVDKK